MNGMTERKHLEFITLLYGMAALLVVFGHSHPLHTTYPNLLEELTHFIYLFHMSIFFFVSGVLIAYTDIDRKVIPWWVKKARKLLLPYVVLTLLAWLPKALLGTYMNDNMSFSFRNIVRILLIPREGIWGHFWFVPVYLLLSLMCACIWKMIKNCGKLSNLFRGGVFLTAVVLNIFPVHVKWFGIEDMTQRLLYVVLGMYLSEYLVVMADKDSESRISENLGWYIGAIAAFLVSVVLFPYSDNVIIDRIICILMLYAIVITSIFLQRFPMDRVKYVGDRAFTIYIYSWPIQVVMEMLIVVALKLKWYVSYPVMFIGGLTVPMVLYEIYKKKMKRNWFLDGMIGIK